MGGLVIVWQSSNSREAFFNKFWHFKDIYREFEAFLKISILIEDNFKEIQDCF
jgi:hypothetical protein